jgi:hypothetical protein
MAVAAMTPARVATLSNVVDAQQQNHHVLGKTLPLAMSGRYDEARCCDPSAEGAGHGGL